MADIERDPRTGRFAPRRPVPDDSRYHNGVQRCAGRDSSACDPSPYLTGLDGPGTPAGGWESAVTVYGDGRGTITPRTSEDVAPGRGRSNGR